MDKEILIAGGIAAATLLFKNRAPDFQPATTGRVVSAVKDQDLTDKFEAEQKLDEYTLNLASELEMDAVDIRPAFSLSDTESGQYTASFDVSKLNLSNTSTLTDKSTIAMGGLFNKGIEIIGGFVNGIVKSVSPLDLTKTVNSIKNFLTGNIKNRMDEAAQRIEDRDNPIQSAPEFSEYSIDWDTQTLFNPDFQFGKSGDGVYGSEGGMSDSML